MAPRSHLGAQKKTEAWATLGLQCADRAGERSPEADALEPRVHVSLAGLKTTGRLARSGFSWNAGSGACGLGRLDPRT